MGTLGNTLSDFFIIVQYCVNLLFGNDYREIYFKQYPNTYYTCIACSKTLKRETPRQVTIDHIVPQKFHGTNAISNLQVLCQPCNSQKGAKINARSLEYSKEALFREIKRLIF